MNEIIVSWRQHCRSPFAQCFAFPSIPHLWWNQKLSRCRLSNEGHQMTLNLLHWLWGWNLKLCFWETQPCRKKARVQDQETSHNHRKTDGNYLYVRVLKSAYNKCVTTSPPVCTKKKKKHNKTHLSSRKTVIQRAPVCSQAGCCSKEDVPETTAMLHSEKQAPCGCRCSWTSRASSLPFNRSAADKFMNLGLTCRPTFQTRYWQENSRKKEERRKAGRSEMRKRPQMRKVGKIGPLVTHSSKKRKLLSVCFSFLYIFIEKCTTISWEQKLKKHHVFAVLSGATPGEVTHKKNVSTSIAGRLYHWGYAAGNSARPSSLMDTFHAAVLLNTIFGLFKCQTVSKETAVESSRTASKDGWKLFIVCYSSKDDLSINQYCELWR